MILLFFVDSRLEKIGEVCLSHFKELIVDESIHISKIKSNRPLEHTLVPQNTNMKGFPS